MGPCSGGKENRFALIARPKDRAERRTSVRERYGWRRCAPPSASLRRQSRSYNSRTTSPSMNEAISMPISLRWARWTSRAA